MPKHNVYTVMDERQLTKPRALARKVGGSPHRRGYLERREALRQHQTKLQQEHDAAQLRKLNRAEARQTEIRRRAQP